MWTLIWSSSAKEEYLDTLQYWIERNGSNTYSSAIAARVLKTESLLSKYPYIGNQIPLGSDTARRYVISREHSIIYQVDKSTIRILSFWDNRRDQV